MAPERVPEEGVDALPEHWGGAAPMAAPVKMRVDEATQTPAVKGMVEALDKHWQAVHPGERNTALGLQQHPPKHDPLAQSKWEEQGSPGENVRHAPVWNAHPPQPRRTAPGEQQAPSRQAPVLQDEFRVQGWPGGNTGVD